MRRESLAALVLASGVACLLAVVQPAANPPTRPLEFWDHFLIRNAIAAENFRTLEELVGSADLVAVAHVVSLTPGREFGDEADKVHYAAAELAIDRLLAGVLPADGVVLEVQLPHGEGAEDVEKYAAAMPGTPMLVFLRNKGVEATAAGLPKDVVEREAPFFRLVRPDAMFLNEDGKAAYAAGGEDSILSREAGLDFEKLVLKIDRLE